PPDEYPGGWEAGVGEYLFRQFERDLKEFVDMYQQGMFAIEAEALAVCGKTYTALTPDLQQGLLANIEKGQVQTVWPIDPVSFFVMLVDHCAEGFYSDPGNGGNEESIAWKMIGFEVTG